MHLNQRAVVVLELDKPVTLIDNWPIPEPCTNQVQVKVTVAGLNPHDQKSRDWGLLILRELSPAAKGSTRDSDFPSVLASDVVGRVTKLGPEVSGLAVGDRIVYQSSFAHGSMQHGLQEYSIADLGALAKIPDSITDDEAATLPTNIITSVVALFDALQIPPPWSSAAKEFDYANTALLIVGGGSNCGKFSVQLARLVNIGRIVVVGGDPTTLMSFGATHVIDRHAGYEKILAEIRNIVGDDLLHAYDTTNPLEGQLLAINALSNSKKGAMARLIPHGQVDESKVLGKRAGFDVRDLFGSSHMSPELAAEFWSRLPGYLERGQIKPLGYIVKNGLEAESVNEVLDAYRDGKRVVKTHFHVSVV